MNLNFAGLYLKDQPTKHKEVHITLDILVDMDEGTYEITATRDGWANTKVGEVKGSFQNWNTRVEVVIEEQKGELLHKGEGHPDTRRVASADQEPGNQPGNQQPGNQPDEDAWVRRVEEDIQAHRQQGQDEQAGQDQDDDGSMDWAQLEAVEGLFDESTGSQRYHFGNDADGLDNDEGFENMVEDMD